MLAPQWAVQRLQKPGGAVVNAEEADLPVPYLAGKPQPILRIDDPAGEEQRFRGIKVIRVFQEERPLFWEEDFIALVGRDLRLVGFNLAEVGIDRRVQRERIVDYDFGVKPAAIGLLGLHGRRGSGRVQRFL